MFEVFILVFYNLPGCSSNVIVEEENINEANRHDNTTEDLMLEHTEARPNQHNVVEKSLPNIGVQIKKVYEIPTNINVNLPTE